MNSPNERLMRHYGTRDVFMEKAAGGMSLLERLSGALMGEELVREGNVEEKKVHREDALRDQAVREAALQELSQATNALRGVPILTPAGYDDSMVRMAMVAVQIGEDLAKNAGIGDFVSGVVPAIKNFGGAVGGLLKKTPAVAGAAAGGPYRAAAAGAAKTVASAAPAAAKEGPGLLQKLKGPLGWKSNALLIGGTLGAGYLANKAIHKGLGAMGRESAGSPVYGSGRLGYNPPQAVNEYGVAQ